MVAAVRTSIVLACAFLPGLSRAGAEEVPATGDAPPRVWRACATLDREVLREVSGIVESRQYPGVFWAHADSGNDPKIVAFDTAGKILAEVAIAKAPNTDWEDIAADDQGNLYIGDIGNNKAMFPTRYIYRIVEPDPRNPPDHPVPVARRWRFKYPDDRRFNGEGLFWHDGSLYVCARGGSVSIYRLEGDRERDMVLRPLKARVLAGTTGADVSADGSRLVLCNPVSACVYTLTGGEELVEAEGRRAVSFPSGGCIEGVCFSGTDVVLIGEHGALYRITEQDFTNQVRFVRP